jgi:hypothetical protein
VVVGRTSGIGAHPSRLVLRHVPAKPEPCLSAYKTYTATMQSNYFITSDPLSLDRIRNVLTRLEDTILFQLIERAQFAHNPRMYIPGTFPELVSQGFSGTWLEWFLKEIETFHGMWSSQSWSLLYPHALSA